LINTIKIGNSDSYENFVNLRHYYFQNVGSLISTCNRAALTIDGILQTYSCLGNRKSNIASRTSEEDANWKRYQR